MKKNLIFLLTFVALLGAASFASAIVLQDPLGGGSFTGLICSIVFYVSGLIGGLAVLMFVVSAIFYVTSAGDPTKIATAKKILVSAVIGSAIALAATGLIELIAKIIGAKGGGGC